MTAEVSARRGSDLKDDGALIDAVFVTSNARDQAFECIAHLNGPDVASIIAVDNASSDGTADVIRATHPDVTVLGLDSPVGLAAALNRGAELGRAPFVLYLNDDVFAAPGSVRRLLETLQGRDDAVAAAGRLVERDLATQDRYRPRAFPTPSTLVVRLLGLERLWRRNPWTGGHLRRMLDDYETVTVDQLAGACLLVRRSAVERIGGWDERYWFWYEDVDFLRRLAAEGTRLYVPAAPFWHVGGSTARRLSRADGHRRMFHGVLVYARTYFSGPGRACVALALVGTCAVRAIVALSSDRQAARAYAASARAGLALLAGRPPVGLGNAGVDHQSAPPADGPACPVCRSPVVLTTRFRPTLLRACIACGLLFRAAARDEKAVRQMYSADSYTDERIDALISDRAHDADQRTRWIEPRVSGRRLLDLGAGAGFFVAKAAERGFQATGLEPSERAANYARTRLGVDVRTGFLETVELPEGGFDVVCMWHVLEHAVDPLALLRGVLSLLGPDGRLVVEVPNIDSVAANLMRGRWAHLDPSAHLYHFSPRSLTAALETAGYAVLQLETLLESYYDRPSVRLRPRRLAGRAVRALALRTLAQTHPTGGELLRAIAVPAA